MYSNLLLSSQTSLCLKHKPFPLAHCFTVCKKLDLSCLGYCCTTLLQAILNCIFSSILILVLSSDHDSKSLLSNYHKILINSSGCSGSGIFLEVSQPYRQALGQSVMSATQFHGHMLPEERKLSRRTL